MTNVESYVLGAWHPPTGSGVEVYDAVTGEPVAFVGRAGVDGVAVLEHARRAGGEALREMTFRARAGMLRELAAYLAQHTEELYALSTATGATRSDAWLDVEGGIAVVKAYAARGERDLPDSPFLVDGDTEVLSREGSFVGAHLCTPLQGVAVHVNAFNFPCWGMLEKLSAALLAGVPSVVKPATQTAYVAEALFRSIVSSGALPDGAAQLVCGTVGDLLDHLGGQDVVAFTGSAATAAVLRSHRAVTSRSTRFNAEADSLNCAILGPSVAAGSREFELYVREVVRETTVKAGQRCTAIRRALVPAGTVDAVVEAVSERLAAVVVGNPARDGVDMGPLVGHAQRAEVRKAIAELASDSTIVRGGGAVEPVDADGELGAFVAPTLLVADRASRAVHDVEAFGPVCTVVAFEGVDDAVDLARRGQGSLVASVFTGDHDEARALVLGVAAHHGRVLVVDDACGQSSTGHGSPLPYLVHGGPGRAGGGEELGGMRGLLRYLQRTAVQGAPGTLEVVCAG